MMANGIDVDAMRMVAVKFEAQVGALVGVIKLMSTHVAKSTSVQGDREARGVAGSWSNQRKPALAATSTATVGSAYCSRENAGMQGGASVVSGEVVDVAAETADQRASSAVGAKAEEAAGGPAASRVPPSGSAAPKQAANASRSAATYARVATDDNHECRFRRVDVLCEYNSVVIHKKSGQS